MTPCVVRDSTSQCAETTLSNWETYSMQVRIMPALWTPWPSSEKATAPSMTMSPISASVSPFSPTVSAPMGRTWQRPAWRERSIW